MFAVLLAARAEPVHMRLRLVVGALTFEANARFANALLARVEPLVL